jgi:hypothetical protein
MEWAVHIKDAADLCGEASLERVAGFEQSEVLHPLIDIVPALIREGFSDTRFTRVVYGTEFCENLIPKAESLSGVIRACDAQGLALTFVTPYVSDRGLALLRPLLDLLPHGAEVVFNDWGVLNLLRRDHPSFVPVQGRLLNKSLRDPRVTTQYAAAPAPAAAITALQRSNLDCDSYVRLLLRLGVQTVEMDNLPQGNDLAFAGKSLAVNIYFPFGFISTSRACMAAGLHYHKTEKFQPGAPCRHECQTHLLEYAYTNSPFGNREQKFYQKGNTHFYFHTEAMLRALFDEALAGRIARLVYQPRIPMMA